MNPLSILEYSINQGKNILLPRVESETLSFHSIRNLNDLVLNKYGIYEPGTQSNKVDIEDIDLFILPGLAFDLSGNRIGYGKGFYDKTLSDVSSNKLIGFCYLFQILNALPATGHDKRAGFIVSEDGFLSCKS